MARISFDEVAIDATGMIIRFVKGDKVVTVTGEDYVFRLDDVRRRLAEAFCGAWEIVDGDNGSRAVECVAGPLSGTKVGPDNGELRTCALYCAPNTRFGNGRTSIDVHQVPIGSTIRSLTAGASS